MSYDRELAEQIRDVLGERDDVSERAMFGGLAFLVGGHMAVCAGSRGQLMVRIDPDEGEHLAATTIAEPTQMRGRPMRGWLDLDTAGFAEPAELATWIERALRQVASLPPKGS